MLAFSAAPPRLGRFGQLCVCVVIVIILAWTLLTRTTVGTTIQQQIPVPHKAPAPGKSQHPIEDLMRQADENFQETLAKESRTIQEAELAYVVRRKHRPPPGFDLWFKFAQGKKAVIVEDFFDRIYEDLRPFWGYPPYEMRVQAHNWFFQIRIRDGRMLKHGDDVDRPWMNLWGDLIASVAQYLPDLDIPINEMDESRIVAPWEEINRLVEEGDRKRVNFPVAKIITEYRQTIIPDKERAVPSFDFAFQFDGPYWKLAAAGCHPESPARSDYKPDYNYAKPPEISPEHPAYSHEGYVANWTLAKSLCDNPSLQGLHGTFVEPLSTATTKRLFPMFGGSKLSVNNEILLPAAMYWTDDPFYSGGDWHGGEWKTKQNKAIWRGAASGGRNREENWTRFQRHRFVAMMNGTTLQEAGMSGKRPKTFTMPSYEAYQVEGTKTGSLGRWISEIADAAFVHLLCFPDTEPPFCPYTNPHYAVAEQMPMKQQYDYKYLPDIDGNSFSGRYRGFLASTSLPIKATIYNEWHDSRLVPWKHFVPMHNTFVDIYGILDYFIGSGGSPGHDNAAKNIAMSGHDWAQKVLRKEDMQVYVYRLLLEYARLVDDNREQLAYLSFAA